METERMSRNDLELREAAVLSQTSLGQYLRAAREASGIHLEDVSKYLKIKRSVIQNIEEDDYRQGLPEVFIRGYLRSYAKFLGLPENPILSAFVQTHATPREVPIVAMPHEVQEKKISTWRDRPIRWFTYGVGVILFILVGLWWHGRDPDTGTDLANLGPLNGSVFYLINPSWSASDEIDVTSNNLILTSQSFLMHKKILQSEQQITPEE